MCCSLLEYGGGEGKVYASHKLLICFISSGSLDGLCGRLNVEHELVWRGAASVPLLKLQGSRPVCHAAEIKVAPRTCGNTWKTWAEQDIEVRGKAGEG